MNFKKAIIAEHVAKVTSWNPIKEIPNKEFHYLDLSCIDKDKKKINENRILKIFGKDAPSRAKQITNVKDVLVATVRPNLNGIAILEKEFANATASTGYCVLRTKETLYSKYLYYWVQTKWFIEDMINKASGASYPAVTDKIIKRSKIPLPPLPIQKHIAEVLDTADQHRQQCQQILKKYDQLAQSVFLDMFDNPTHNQKSFLVGTIRDLVTEVKYGTSSKAEVKGAYPYLRMNNITYSGSMDFSSLKYINLSEKDKPKYLVKKGDLLFNRTNSKELVGKTAVFRENQDMAIAGYLIRVRTNEKANTEFISGYLNSIHGKLTLRNMCKSIVGMANINAQELQNIKITLPPIELQNRFAAIIENIEAQKTQAKTNLAQANDLFNSLLQKSFKGEL